MCWSASSFGLGRRHRCIRRRGARSAATTGLPGAAGPAGAARPARATGGRCEASGVAWPVSAPLSVADVVVAGDGGATGLGRLVGDQLRLGRRQRGLGRVEPGLQAARLEGGQLLPGLDLLADRHRHGRNGAAHRKRHVRLMNRRDGAVGVQRLVDVGLRHRRPAVGGCAGAGGRPDPESRRDQDDDDDDRRDLVRARGSGSSSGGCGAAAATASVAGSGSGKGSRKSSPSSVSPVIRRRLPQPRRRRSGRGPRRTRRRSRASIPKTSAS